MGRVFVPVMDPIMGAIVPNLGSHVKPTLVLELMSRAGLGLATLVDTENPIQIENAGFGFVHEIIVSSLHDMESIGCISAVCVGTCFLGVSSSSGGVFLPKDSGAVPWLPVQLRLRNAPSPRRRHS